MPSSNFTFRMPDELREKLKQRAEQEGRTLSNLVTYILKEAVSNEQVSSLHHQEQHKR